MGYSGFCYACRFEGNLSDEKICPKCGSEEVELYDNYEDDDAYDDDDEEDGEDYYGDENEEEEE